MKFISMIKKRIHVIAGILLVLGILLVSIGIGIGGSPAFAFQYDTNTKKIELLTPNNKGTDSYEQETIRMEEFRELELNAEMIEVRLEVSEDFFIEYSTRPGEFVYKEESGKLRINQTYLAEDSNKIHFVNFMDVEEEVEEYIIIGIPKDHRFEEVSIANAGADIQIDFLLSKDLDIDTKGGQVNINFLEADSVQVKGEGSAIYFEKAAVQSFVLTDQFSNMQLLECDIEKIEADMRGGSLWLERTAVKQLDVDTEGVDTHLTRLKVNGITNIKGDNSTVEAEDFQTKELHINGEQNNFTGNAVKVRKFNAAIEEFSEIFVEKLQVEELEFILDSGEVNIELADAAEKYYFDLKPGAVLNGSELNADSKVGKESSKPVKVRGASVTIETRD